MSFTRVKICGIRNEKDIEIAVKYGVDAIGFIFYKYSKKYISIEKAAKLRRIVPPFVDVVSVFVNNEPQYIKKVLKFVNPDILQFHGDESSIFCCNYGKRFIRSFRVGSTILHTQKSILENCIIFKEASGWLFDKYSKIKYGGTGKIFDYSMLDLIIDNPIIKKPIILSGGLNKENIVYVIKKLRPWAIDISSGVEDFKGNKSEEKIVNFMKKIRSID